MLDEPIVASPNAMGAFRSYPSVDSTSYPYSQLSHDIIQVTFQRKKPLGLCMNNFCRSRPKEASKSSNAKYTRGFITTDKKMIDCPICKAALYWAIESEHLLKDILR